jgi:hypothetical protein
VSEDAGGSKVWRKHVTDCNSGIKVSEDAGGSKVWRKLVTLTVYSAYKTSFKYLLTVWHHLGPDGAGLSEVYCTLI